MKAPRLRRLLRIGAGLVLATGLGCATPPPAPEVVRPTSDARKARSHYGLGLDHLREGRVALAIRDFRAAHELTPHDKWVNLSLAEAYRLKGKTDDAERHMIEALRLDPDFQAARLNLSALYIQLERYQEALNHTSRLIDDPTFPVPWKALSNEGWAHYRLGDPNRARDSLEMALEYHDTYVPALLSLAVVDSDQGRHLDALTRYERILEITPSPLALAEANYRAAEVYVSLGNRTKAVHHLIAATEQKPSGDWGRRSEDYLRRLR